MKYVGPYIEHNLIINPNGSIENVDYHYTIKRKY